MVLPWVATIRAAMLAGQGLFGLTGAAGFGGVITTDAPIALRECVAAVGAQRHPISTGRSGPARVGDLFDW